MEMESSSPVHTRPIGFRSLSVYPPRVRREHSAPRPRRGKGFAPAFAESPPDAGTLRLVFRFAPVHGEYAAMDGTPLRIRRPFCPQPSSSNARWHHTGGSRDRNDPHPQPARLRRRRYPAACLPARHRRARTVPDGNRDWRVGTCLYDASGVARLKVTGRMFLPPSVLALDAPHTQICPLLEALTPIEAGTRTLAARREHWALAWITLSDKGAAGLRVDESGPPAPAPNSRSATNKAL